MQVALTSGLTPRLVLEICFVHDDPSPLEAPDQSTLMPNSLRDESVWNPFVNLLRFSHLLLGLPRSPANSREQVCP